MATVTAPLLSFGASGQIGKSMVFGSWKGITYARKHVIPANPNSTAQQSQRNVFKWVHDAYKFLDGNVTEAWDAYSKGKPFTAPNAWAMKNMPVLKGQPNINAIIGIPAVAGGPPNQAITLTPGASKITVLGVPPALPAGWTIVHMIATAIKQQVPSGEVEPLPSFTFVKAASPWSVDITGLTTGQVYNCWAGWKFTRSDGTFAYGGSTNAQATAA